MKITSSTAKYPTMSCNFQTWKVLSQKSNTGNYKVANILARHATQKTRDFTFLHSLINFFHRWQFEAITLVTMLTRNFNAQQNCRVLKKGRSGADASTVSGLQIAAAIKYSSNHFRWDCFSAFLISPTPQPRHYETKCYYKREREREKTPINFFLFLSHRWSTHF